MKIALTVPVYWPYIKRGGRMLNGLAHFLRKQGHEVTIVTSKPGKTREVIREGIRIIYNREYSYDFISPSYKYQLLAWPFFLSFLHERFDIIQSLFYIDAFGISCTKPFRNNKYIFYVPDGNIFEVKGRIDQYMIKRTMLSAEALVVPSVYIQQVVQAHYGLQGIVIPPGVDTSYFFPSPAKDLEHPKILCMAELGMPRKRIPLLVKAFQLFKRSVPGAVLQLSGRIDSIFAKILFDLSGPEFRDSIQILGVGKEKDIPLLYADAAMTVLPAVKEAFGMVLIESLSAGTPVVGTWDGGIPEIITNNGVGVLFDDEGDNGAEALSEAMLRCLALAKEPKTTGRCRQQGQKYDWSVIGPRLEALYREIIDN